MKLSVVIPCFNEGQSLPGVLRRIDDLLDRDDVEVIFVDNGSTDQTAVVLGEAVREHGWARSCRVAVNVGYGHGLLAGLALAKGDWLGWTHGDGQTDFADVLRGLEIIESSGGARDLYIKGRRRGRPWRDRVFSLGMGVVATVVFRRWLVDINAEPNLFPRAFFETWEAPPEDYQIELFALSTAARRGMRIQRVEVAFPERVHGQSSWNTGLRARLALSGRTIRAMVRLARR